MKDKNQKCPKCKNKMKYKGHRVFYCKTCKKTIKILHPNEKIEPEGELES